MDFLNSGLGQYIVQTVFHSAIIAVIVEAIINIWRVDKPSLQIKFRLLSLLLSVLYLPFLYLVYPERTGTHFHEQTALIDFNQWLGLTLGGGVALWHPFVALLALTTLFFLIKEGIPSIRYCFFGHRLSLPLIEEGQFPELDSVLANLSKATGHPMPTVFLSAEDFPVLYTLGPRALVLSVSTIDMLDEKELESVIAHELAHLIKRASAINRLFLALRFLMFYNPVALLVFRHVISDNEKTCDDMAVALSGKQLALASGLLKVLQSAPAGSSREVSASGKRWLSLRASSLGNRAHRELVKGRVERLAHLGRAADVPYENFRIVLTAGLLVALLFFVV